MSRSLCNKKGFGMIEVIIALFMTVVAVLGVFSLVSPAWRTSTRSDYLGRASGILYEELIRQEARIMNPCCSVTAGTLPAVAVNTSGQTTAQAGDVQFNVNTTITDLSTATSPNFWGVTVRVTWPGHTGISESLVVSRQDGFTSTLGCTLGGTACQ
jgi:Tfp pilus assembly protein PilV